MQKVIIAGAGGIGKATALFLANGEIQDLSILIGDRDPEYAGIAAEWVRKGFDHDVHIQAFHLPEVGSSPEFEALLEEADLLLDCLPGSQAPRMAGFARKYRLHYANLTEYIKETQEIVSIAKGAETGFVLQTGLAPGYINILANGLYRRFAAKYGVEKVEHIVMRVGALTKQSRSPHFYGFTWSPIGVATEYVRNSVVLRDFKKTVVPALSDRETVVIDGVPYEADLTSGGAADLADTFKGIARRLDYKTLRYPGHYHWVESIIQGIGSEEQKIKALEETMRRTVPVMEEDVVVIYSAVLAYTGDNILRAMTKSHRIRPIRLGYNTLSAIQATTAAPLAEAARHLLKEKWQGIVFQSEIEPEEFLSGPFIRLVYRENDEPILL